jgi:hypothetical protein
MKHRMAAGLLATVLFLPALSSATSLQDELIAMGAEDQALLKDHNKSAADQEAMFAMHTLRLKALVKENGWPRLSTVGTEASQAAWLLVQHADAERGWQREALALMEGLLPANEIKYANVAYLSDRIDIADHLPQKYGTQGHCVAPGLWEPFSLYDPARVDQRRAAMKLPPLADYVAMAAEYMCKPKQ